jgi:hypothetical protein
MPILAQLKQSRETERKQRIEFACCCFAKGAISAQMWCHVG